MDVFIARWRAAAMSTPPSKEPTVTCTTFPPLRTSPAPSKPAPTSTLLPFEATGPLLHLTEPPSLPPTPPRTRTATPQPPKPAPKQSSTSPTTSTSSTLSSLTTTTTTTTTPPQTWPTPHPHIHITTPKPTHLQPLKRLHSTLLPIRYSDKFFTETIHSPEHNTLSRVAIYTAPSQSSGAAEAREEVVGAIRARLEDEIPSPVAETGPEANPQDEDNNPPENNECANPLPRKNKKKLYIQTILLLSPYRSHGVATTLLSSLLTSIQTTSPPIEIVAVQAHVHETNEEALDWYRKRGFQVLDRLVEGYYRKLKPSGARIARMDLTPGLAGCVVNVGRKAGNERGERAKRKREVEECSEVAVGE